MRFIIYILLLGIFSCNLEDNNPKNYENSLFEQNGHNTKSSTENNISYDNNKNYQTQNRSGSKNIGFCENSNFNWFTDDENIIDSNNFNCSINDGNIINSYNFNSINSNNFIHNNSNAKIKVIKKKISLKNFNKINLRNIGHLIVKKGENASITIIAEKRLLKNIKVSIINNELIIKLESNNKIIIHKEIKYHLTIPDSIKLTKIKSSGITKIDFIKSLENSIKNLEIESNNQSYMKFDKKLKCNDLIIKSNNQSHIKFNEKLECKDLSIKSNNQSAIDFNELVNCKNLEIKSKHQANIEFNKSVSYYTLKKKSNNQSSISLN